MYEKIIEQIKARDRDKKNRSSDPRDNKIFATRRGYGELKDGWEFPGGKVETSETPSQAPVPEIEEELDTEIEVGELLYTIEYDYPAFHLSMDCFIAG